MNRILYYLVVLPISWIPLRILYVLSHFIYFLLYFVIGYRKKVVFSNLRNSFPEKSEVEIIAIAKSFYHHLSDNLLEIIRLFSISKTEVLRRCKVVNPEIFQPFLEEQQNIVIVAAHFNNWEFAGLALQEQIPHQVFGLMTNLNHPFWNKKIIDSRSRFGLNLVDKSKLKSFLTNNQQSFSATVFIGDQSPSSAKKQLYWTTFLNQETGVMLGAEKFARRYNYPIFYGHNRKIKKGYYEISFELIERNPIESKEFAITEKHLRLLETEIRRDPSFWLWSHRRWKRKRENITRNEGK